MLQTANDDFSGEIEKASVGGPTDTAAKKPGPSKVVRHFAQAGRLRADHGQGPEGIAQLGFEARSRSRAQHPLDQPAGLRIKNGTTGELIARIAAVVKNSNLYEGRASIDGGTTWMPSVFTGDSRHIIFDGLTAGKTYTIEVRALGGSTGQSDWSDPVSHMAM